MGKIQDLIKRRYLLWTSRCYHDYCSG